MKNEIYDFIHRGYFPKELPPAFNTYLFAVQYEDVHKEWSAINSNPSSRLPKKPSEKDSDYKERISIFKDPVSIPVLYSYAKGRISRRDLSILNPINFLDLALCIDANQQDIHKILSQSTFSQSIPTYDIYINKRCYRPNNHSVWSLTQKKLSLSQGKLYELKLDISTFYPSIYTHSITWSVIGKEKAKSLWRQHGDKCIAAPSNAEEQLYNIAHQLDHCVQRCQDKQTHGIPIGPDTSFIISEIVATYIDKELGHCFPKLKGCRYYDDYTLYVDTKEEASAVIYKIQNIISEFGLTLNENKIAINEAPKPFIEDYVEELAPFNFEAQNQTKALTKYFNALWRFCDAHPNKANTIIKYGLRPLESASLKVQSLDIHVFESLLYKTALIEPSALNQVCELIIKKGYTPTKSSLEELAKAIIANHAPLNHHHEVSWALWIIKKYDLSLSKDLIKWIFGMDNAVCSLLTLDYLNNNGAESNLLTDIDIQSEISSLENNMSTASLFNEDWILCYEGAFHGWLQTDSIVKSNPYFKYLFDQRISFYDKSNSANYQSYDYIEHLPVDVYTKEMRKKAKEYKTQVMEEVYDQIFGELDDDEVLSPENKDFLKQKCKLTAKNLNVEKDIFDRILSQVFRRDTPNLESYIKEVAGKLNILANY